MQVDDVLELLDVLRSAGLDSWLDGGWGVDALLGEVTRDHGDVDLVVRRDDLVTLDVLLTARGFAVTRDLLPTAVAYADPAGREVDLHPVDPTDDGGGDQRLADGGVWHYGPPVTGSLAGRVVRCCAAEEQVRMHLGYPPRDVDRADVARLARRFGLELPPELAPESTELP